MASILNIPFNFQPVNAGSVSNGSYTVPTGRYARIVATLSCHATSSITSSSAGSAPIPNLAPSTQSTTITLFLSSGNVVTTQGVSASGVVTNTASVYIYGTATSTASLLVGGVVVSKIFASTIGGSWSGNTNTTNFSGGFDVSYHYEEYNNIV